MDIKISGITPAILEEALAQAKVARFEILDVIESAIAEPRPELAPTAPKIDSIQIPVDKIKVVIGKGGETIDKIIAETGVTIDIDEEGLVQIFSSNQDAINRAKAIISDLVREAKVGEVYTVPVVRIEKFGAFVHLFNKTDALIHISELAWERTEHVEDVVKVGGTVTVKIIKSMKKDVSMPQLKPCFLSLKNLRTGKMEESSDIAVVLIINHATIMKVVKHRKILINQKRKNRQKNNRKSRIASF